MSDMFFWIRKDLADFYEAVKLLSDSINHSQIDWRDEKYRELSEKIQVVADLLHRLYRRERIAKLH